MTNLVRRHRAKYAGDIGGQIREIYMAMRIDEQFNSPWDSNAVASLLIWETGEKIFHGQALVQGMLCYAAKSHDGVIPLHELICREAAR